MKLDWKKTNTELSREHGISRQAIAGRRDRAILEAAGFTATRGRPTKKPATIDWTLPDDALMAAYGVSASAIRLWRVQEHGPGKRGRPAKITTTTTTTTHEPTSTQIPD